MLTRVQGRRALSKARIQVKSDGKAPRVRSSKLRPRRQVRTDPAMQRDSGKGLNESDVLAGLERGRTVVRTARLLSDVEEIASREDLVARRGLKSDSWRHFRSSLRSSSLRQR